jgi:hypothetical protein
MIPPACRQETVNVLGVVQRFPEIPLFKFENRAIIYLHLGRAERIRIRSRISAFCQSFTLANRNSRKVAKLRFPFSRLLTKIPWYLTPVQEVRGDRKEGSLSWSCGRSGGMFAGHRLFFTIHDAIFSYSRHLRMTS